MKKLRVIIYVLISCIYINHRAEIMDVALVSRYEAQPHILKLQVSVLECGIMCPEVKFLMKKNMNFTFINS